MKLFKIFGLLVFVSAFTLFSCSTDSEIDNPTIDEMDMMEDPNDGEGNDLGDAPAFSMETTSGDKLESSEYQGKNLVIWFFGAGCPPCRSIGPSVESNIYQAFKDNDKFAMIGGDQWNDPDTRVDDFAEVTGVTFPLGKQAASVARDFGTTYDRFVIINSEGKIVFKSSNRVSNHIDEAADIIKGLLE